jgi:hypothetical protein
MEEIVTKYKKHLFWIFPLLSILLYWQARYAGFVFDFTGWYNRYTEGSWSDVLNCFGYPGLHQVLEFFNYTLYYFFDTNPYAWFFPFAIFHGINTYLLFLASGKMMNAFGKSNLLIPFFCALLFLVHPNQTEAVVWKVCAHYLIATGSVLIVLYALFSFYLKQEKKYKYYALIAFVLGLFSTELTFCVPFMIAIFMLFVFVQKQELVKSYLWQFFVPVLLVQLAYLLLNRLLIGDFVGHYGAEVHLNFDLIAILSAELKYALKGLVFMRYFIHSIKMDIVGVVSSLGFLIPFYLVLALIYFKLFYRWNKQRVITKILVLSSLFFMASILPVSNLYVLLLLLIKNDIYGYLSIAFIAIIVVNILFVLPHYLKYTLLTAYLLTSFCLQRVSIMYWQQSAEVLNALVDDFRWYDATKVYILCAADNIKGVPIFSTVRDLSLLDDYLFIHKKRTDLPEIEDVYLFNMARPTDGLSVEVLSDNTASVTFNQWGNWLWRNLLGASNRDNERFKTKMKSKGFDFERRDKRPGVVYIYQDGLKWKEVEEW